MSTSWTITSSDVAAGDHVLDVADPAGPTFETWSSPSVPFFSSTNAPNWVVLTTLPVYVSPTSGSFVSPLIAAIAASAFVP